MVCEPASGEQLRRLWQNLKTRQRDGLTRERQHRMATGGGGPCPDAGIDPNIAEISPALFVEVRDSIDSDCNVSELVNPVQIDSDIIIEEEHIMSPQPFYAVDIEDTPTIIDANQHTSATDAVELTEPVVPIEPVSQPHSSTQQNNTTQDSFMDFSSNEKKLRVQILKNEFINREKRANALHSIDVKYKKLKYELEIEILKKQLQEATAKAESAHNNPC